MKSGFRRRVTGVEDDEAGNGEANGCGGAVAMARRCGTGSGSGAATNRQLLGPAASWFGAGRRGCGRRPPTLMARKRATTTARFSGAQRSGEAVADVRQGMAAVWRTDSSVLDSDVAAATVQRTTPTMKSEDGTTTDLTKDIAEGTDEKIHM